jgi:hypothetical protein
MKNTNKTKKIIPMIRKKPLMNMIKPLKSNTLFKIKPLQKKVIKPMVYKNPFALKPMKLKPAYKRTMAEKKLIRTKPWGDKDGDGVPNWIDCKPFDRKRQGEYEDSIKRKIIGRHKSGEHHTTLGMLKDWNDQRKIRKNEGDFSVKDYHKQLGNEEEYDYMSEKEREDVDKEFAKEKSRYLKSRGLDDDDEYDAPSHEERNLYQDEKEDYKKESKGGQDK